MLARLEPAWNRADGRAFGDVYALVVLTGDPRFTILFPFQAGLAVWLVGTGVRLLRR